MMKKRIDTFSFLFDFFENLCYNIYRKWKGDIQ